MSKPGAMTEEALKRAAERIVFPLDFNDPAEATGFARLLRGRVGIFKVGLELFVSAGPSILEKVGGAGGIFLDLKFHDIPATVRAASQAASRAGARFISVHAGGGSTMMEAAVDGAGDQTGVLAITALTSLDSRELSSIGLREGLTDPRRLVLHRATMAREAGCAGIVCSGQEARAVKDALGESLVILVPGIRTTWSRVPGDDQTRVTSAAAAVGDGADYIVVGRPIRLAPDPVEAASRIAAEIAGALG